MLPPQSRCQHPSSVPSLFGGLPALSGTVLEGVGQSGRVLAAHGRFTIPVDAAAGDFQLWTGGVPFNPGQTKVNLLTEIREVTRGDTDARWQVISL